MPLDVFEYPQHFDPRRRVVVPPEEPQTAVPVLVDQRPERIVSRQGACVHEPILRRTIGVASLLRGLDHAVGIVMIALDVAANDGLGVR